MDHSTLRAHFDREFGLLRAATAATPPDRKVPSCPDWTAEDLGHHVAEVYRHKAAAIRGNAQPKPWPPARPAVPAVEALDAAYAELAAEFDAHSPADPAWTWGPDQTVGFWIRRMAHETVVHRVDAELAAGTDPAAVTPVDAELARDTVAELLWVFMDYASVTWPEAFGELLTGGDRRPVGLAAGPAAWWTVTVTPGGVRIAEDGRAEPADCAATVTAPDAATLALWLWNRLPEDSVATAGDAALLEQFHRLRILSTQ